MEVDAFIMCNNNINNSDHEADISEARPLGLCLCLCCVFPFTVSLREASAGGTRQVSLGNHQGHWVCQKNQAAMAGAGRLVRQRRHVALSAAAVKAIWQIKVLVEKQGTTAQGAD